MKNKLTWRLSKLPTVSELQELVNNKIITQEEAREILFKTETEEEVKDSVKESDLKAEIKFLRELVEKLSSGNRSTVIEYIYTKPWNYHWFQPYISWCSSGSGTSGTVYASGGNSTTSTNGTLTYYTGGSNFSDIKTF